MIHIGQLIHQELIKQERTPAWLAKKIFCQRPNMYYIFNQPSINTDMLYKISKALNRDFFSEYSKQLLEEKE
ncbi:MAG: XRE family transcriptional regulator [Bacteroides sp.]|nr:XRE family transcriptional regulator [Bacteroides sp.]MCM1414156.1 XRE family transcriptional regulator [Bacteroides sp.]